MKVQVTVVVTPPGGFSSVDSTTLLLDPSAFKCACTCCRGDDWIAVGDGQYECHGCGCKASFGDDPDVIVANAARQVARRLGLGKPTSTREGGRGR